MIEKTLLMFKAHIKPPELATTSHDEAKHAALQFILDAWEEAVYEGIDPDAIATAAIFAALSSMISTYGEEPVAVMAERLSERIRAGEFTIVESRQ